VSTAKSQVLTPDQSRAARRELALSQKDTIAQTGIAAYKLKQFEAGSFRPDMATLKTLRDFYEKQGVNFAELDAYIKGGKFDGAAVDEEGEPSKAALKPGMTLEPRPGFLISLELPSSVVDKLYTDMETSDDRISEIVKTSIKSGLFSEFSAETEALVQELYAHLAVNYLRFRILQGRNIIEPMRDEAKTIGNYLAQWVAGQGVQINQIDEGRPLAKGKSLPELDFVEQE
jgi:transcriptional regulator with XRE-family HTH domain